MLMQTSVNRPALNTDSVVVKLGICFLRFLCISSKSIKTEKRKTAL